MKQFKNISKPKLIKISIAVFFLIASLVIAFITAFQGGQPYVSKAWSKTFITAEAICPGNGVASIKVTVTNQEGKTLKAFVTDTQTGGTVDLGVIEHNKSATGTIETNKQTLKNGTVRVRVEWVTSTGSDTLSANYEAVGCEQVTPTASPTATPPPATPTPRFGACGYTPCNDSTNPCSSGLTCIQADNGKFYCAKPELEQTCKSNPSGGSCCFAATSTPTPTSTPNNTPTVTPTGTITPQPTSTITPTATLTPTPTITPSGTITPQPTGTVTPTATLTPQPTSTGNPKATPTEIVVAQVSNTPTTRPPTTEPTIPSAGIPVSWVILAVPVLFMMVGLLF